MKILKILSYSLMGNDCSVPGYYKLAEVEDFDRIMPHVFSEDDEEVPVSSRKTLPVRHSQTNGGKKSSKFRSLKYGTSIPAPHARPCSGRSKKFRRRRLKKRPKKRPRRNTDSCLDFKAINSLICNKRPVVLAFLVPETKLSINHGNPRASGISLCSRCKKATRNANESHYKHQYRSQQCQDSKHNPCIQYCKYCKLNAFPCADYCRACCKSVSKRSRLPRK